jgi:AraC-like DNA-binding protein/mannose-6-phosphate isomerase-like protein (cupin superfamily)
MRTNNSRTKAEKAMNVFIRNLDFSDINARDIGHEICKGGHSYGFAIRNYYLIHYVESGTGRFICDNGNKVYEVGAGQVFVIRPGEVTKYIADKEDPWTYTWVGFDGSLAKKLNELKEPVFKLNTRVFDMLKKAEAYTNMREHYITGCVHILLCDIFEVASFSDKVMYIKNYIESNYMNNIKVEEIAKSARLDRKYLARIFKERTGKTMREYICECRMNEAKKLIDMGYNVNESAIMLGYSDQSTFSRAYKNYHKKSPKEK